MLMQKLEKVQIMKDLIVTFDNKLENHVQAIVYWYHEIMAILLNNLRSSYEIKTYCTCISLKVIVKPILQYITAVKNSIGSDCRTKTEPVQNKFICHMYYKQKLNFGLTNMINVSELKFCTLQPRRILDVNFIRN